MNDEEKTLFDDQTQIDEAKEAAKQLEKELKEK